MHTSTHNDKNTRILLITFLILIETFYFYIGNKVAHGVTLKTIQGQERNAKVGMEIQGWEGMTRPNVGYDRLGKTMLQ
jgi:hypothetical protein